MTGYRVSWLVDTDSTEQTEEFKMAKFWYKRIKGDITRIDEVPELWREKVRQMIEDAQKTASDE